MAPAGPLTCDEYTRSTAQRGPVTLLNRDEAALKIKGPGGSRIEGVGSCRPCAQEASIASRWWVRTLMTTD